MIKCVALMENTSCTPEFASEHGLSLYIETAKHKILFDSGQSPAFAENAARLGIDLGEVDLAILSHGHYDHGGGLAHFLEINDHASIYSSRYAFGQYYHGTEKYIGLASELKGNIRFVLTGDNVKIDDELELCSCNNYKTIHPIDSAGLTQRIVTDFVPDGFAHEQYLMIHDEGRKIVFSGCSHKGILNIVEWLQPDVFVGGFHFMKQKILDGKNRVLDEAAEKLMHYDTTYYTCHCTGLEQYRYLKEKMGRRLNYIAAGQEIIIFG